MIDIMLTKDGPMVLGYDTTMGDPETQNAILMLSGRTDLAVLMMACVNGTLQKDHISIRQGYTCSVVVECQFHFESRPEFKYIGFKNMPGQTFVFYDSITKWVSGPELEVFANRLCTVTARGTSLNEAVWRAYKGVDAIQYRNKRFRRDIASPEVDRSKLKDKHYE